MRAKAATVLASLLAALPGAAAGAEAAGVREAACRWIAVYGSGDLDALMALYEPDARVMLHGQAGLQGREAIRAFFAAGAGEGETDFELIIDEIVVHGDLAHLISRYWLQRRDAAGTPVYRDVGRSLLLYRRHGDRWRIYLDIDQGTPDARWEDRPADGGSCA
jgi:ketosteroid isomerase-like protein